MSAVTGSDVTTKVFDALWLPRYPVADKYSSTWDVASPIRTTYIYAEIRMLFLSTGRRQMYCPFLNVKFS